MEGITGWQQNEAVGRPLHEILCIEPDGLPAHPRPRRERRRRRQRRPAGTLHIEEAQLAARDGATIPVGITASPLRDELSHPIGTVVAVRDVCERKRAEEAVQPARRPAARSDRGGIGDQLLAVPRGDGADHHRPGAAADRRAPGDHQLHRRSHLAPGDHGRLVLRTLRRGLPEARRRRSTTRASTPWSAPATSRCDSPRAIWRSTRSARLRHPAPTAARLAGGAPGRRAGGQPRLDPALRQARGGVRGGGRGGPRAAGTARLRRHRQRAALPTHPAGGQGARRRARRGLPRPAQPAQRHRHQYLPAAQRRGETGRRAQVGARRSSGPPSRCAGCSTTCSTPRASRPASCRSAASRCRSTSCSRRPAACSGRRRIWPR